VTITHFKVVVASDDYDRASEDEVHVTCWW